MQTDVIAELEAAFEKTTQKPWVFRPGTSAEGDSCDLLMVEVGTAAEDEEPEYTEVLFGGDLSEAERSANWDFLPIAHNHWPALMDVVEAAQEYSDKFHGPYSMDDELKARHALFAALANLQKGGRDGE